MRQRALSAMQDAEAMTRSPGVRQRGLAVAAANGAMTGSPGQRQRGLAVMPTGVHRRGSTDAQPRGLAVIAGGGLACTPCSASLLAEFDPARLRIGIAAGGLDGAASAWLPAPGPGAPGDPASADTLACRRYLSIAVGLSLGSLFLTLPTGGARAFPLIDPSNADQVPQGTELAAPDAQDLKHQLQLSNSLAAPAGGGWNIVPRLDFQEMFTDNVQQVNQPREWDLATYLSPAVHIAGDTPRLQLTFDYAPALSLYARTTSMNALTQQMNGVGLVTVVPDLAFIDVRVLAGVHNLYGGVGGLGTLGASSTGVGSMQASVPSLAGNSLGLSRADQVQTNSFGISPYLLRQFGDWGTGKLGYSFNATASDQLTGFAASPFLSGNGANSQTLLSNEQIAHFATGDFLEPVENSFDVDLMQNQTTSGANYGYGATGVPAANQSYTSTRDFITDKVTWQINRAVAVFGSGGHENIVYSEPGGLNINDMTWSLGTTLTPDPDTFLTISYGHQNGYGSLNVNGRYQITGRTTLTVSYGSTTGTQLENLQSQINLATASGNGSLINGQNGGQLFAGTNALPVQNGVFRYDTLTAGLQTILDRDTIAINLLDTHQTRAGSGSSSSNGTVLSLSGYWQHQLRDAFTLSAAGSYSIQNGVAGAGGPGNSNSEAVSVGLQYQFSETVSTSLRYSFFARQAQVTAYTFYENMLILGVSKSF
nr:hypothetical protein [uncultured Rhodopila sp.]